MKTQSNIQILSWYMTRCVTSVFPFITQSQENSNVLKTAPPPIWCWWDRRAKVPHTAWGASPKWLNLGREHKYVERIQILLLLFWPDDYIQKTTLTSIVKVVGGVFLQSFSGWYYQQEWESGNKSDSQHQGRLKKPLEQCSVT